MGEERFFVTVDNHSTHGSMADVEQFRKRHGEAAMATLKDGGSAFTFQGSRLPESRRVTAYWRGRRSVSHRRSIKSRSDL